MRRLMAATAALVLLASSPALAQSAADRETARSLMDEGDRKREGGDTKAALAAYQAADAIMKVPTTGIEVARTQVALGHLIEAKETLARVLRTPPKRNEPAPFVAARKAAAALDTDVSARIPSLLVTVTGNERTASITIDGEAIPPAAASAARKVNPGPHAIVARAGAAEKKQSVVVAERETKTVTIDLPEPKEAPAPVVAPPPPPESKVSAGPKIMTFGGFGVAAVGVGIGAVTGIMSLKQTSDLKKVCPNDGCPASRQSDIDSANKLGNVSTIAFVAGGVGIVFGVVGVVLWHGQKKEPTTTSLVVGPSSLGLQGVF